MTAPTTLLDPDPIDRAVDGDPYGDDSEGKTRNLISQRIDRSIEKAKNHRTLFEREWMQNLLFGCLAEGTRIPLLHGGEVAIQELVGGEPVWAYGYDLERQRIVPTLITMAWETKPKDCVRIELDTAEVIQCSRDHRFLTWTRGYVEASELRPGDPLVPFRKNQRTRNYEQIFQPADCRWELTHRTVAKEVFGEIPWRYHVHHKSGNRRDNSPENLEILSPEIHATKHGDRIAAGLRRFGQTEEGRKQRLRKSKAAKRRWRRERDKLMASHRAFRARLEFVAKQRERTKAFWDDPSKRANRIAEMHAAWDQRKAAKKINHRIVSVTPIPAVRLFDFSAPGTENVALACGIFAHNSGHHWIIFDRRRGQWRQRGGPEWFPKPVTNKVYEKANDNISSLLMTSPEMSWEPRCDDAASIAAAESADQIDETVAEEVHRKENDRLLATWLVYTGNGFIESYYDNSPEYGTTFLQYEECQSCGYVAGPREFREAGDKCPQCGAAEIKPAMERVGSACPQCRELGEETDYGPAGAFMPCPACEARGASTPFGPEVPTDTAVAHPIPKLQGIYSETKIGEEIPRGKMCEIVRSPFEIFFNHVQVKKFSEEGGLRDCVVSEVMDYQESKEKYHVDLGSTIATPAQGGSLSLQYLESLSVLTALLDPSISPVTAGARGSPAGAQQRVLRETFYELPTRRFPLGLKAIRIQGSNGKVVEFGPLETHRTDENGQPDPSQPFIPIVHYKFHIQAGRVWGRTPISDIVPLNVERNMSRALILLCERRMGNPVWLLPKGLVERDPTGEPGECVWYTHLSAGQGRPPIPQRLQGLEVPRSLWEHIKQLDDEMERLSGSFSIAHGEAPRGVTAASALALLGERQQRSVSPQVQAWELGHEERARQQMLIFREYAQDARVRARRDGMSKWAFEEWSSADLGGAITVRVIPGSAMPKSRAQLAATVEAEIKMGVVDVMNPEVRRRVHEIYGTLQLVEPYEIDVKDAQRENELYLRLTKDQKGGKPFRFRSMIDNHPIHLTEHITFAKSDDFVEIEDHAQQGDPKAAFFVEMFYQHLMEHQTAMAPPMLPTALPAPGAGPAPGPGPGRPEGSGPVLNAGKSEPEGESRAIAEPGVPMPS